MKLVAATCVAFAVSSSALADGFEENHLFVGCLNNTIVELDEDGEFVRAIPLPGVSQPRSLAFGPNGRLYTTSFNTHEVVEIVSNGTISRRFRLQGTAVGPNALSFGPSGNLFVNGFIDRKLHEIDVLSPNATEFGPVAWPTVSLTDFEFSANGTIFAVARDQDFFYELSLNGQIVRFDTFDPFTFPSAIAMGPFQQPWISSFGQQGVLRTTASLAPLNFVTSAQFNAPGGLAIGPNGDLFVCSEGSNRILRVDPIQQQLKSGAELGAGISALSVPLGLVFAPTRFHAEIDYKIALAEKGVKSHDEDVILSIAPGSRNIMVLFEDPETDDFTFASAFQRGFSFHGSEVVEFGNKRICDGNELYLNSAAGAATISLEVKGSEEGDLDFYEASKASGRISRTAAGFSFSGTIKTKGKVD